VCFFGDGATFEGEFHESLVFAAMYDLPVVFVCNNNLYAASMPFSKVSKVENIAEYAKVYGIPGVVADGMDVISVHSAVNKAVEDARKGNGPSIIECKTYRYLVHYSRGKQGLISGHTEFRSKEEIEEWKKRDPIKNLEKKLLKDKILDNKKIEEIKKEIMDKINEAIDFAERSPYPEKEEVMEDVFAC
jgi:TPP-dependent pyruvate/acetoin dehydrogenase alpha subunit